MSGRPKGSGRKAECHPLRAHKCNGLCDPCYQRSRYTPRPKPRRFQSNAEKCRFYYLTHTEAHKARRRARYHSIPLNDRRKYFRIYKSRWARPPQPAVLRPSITQWWKMEVSQLPEDWQVETERPQAKVAIPEIRSVLTIPYDPIELDRLRDETRDHKVRTENWRQRR